MGYLQNQLRAQALILQDDSLTVADAPTGTIAAAAALAVPVVDDDAPTAAPVDPTLTADEKAALQAEATAAAELEERKQEARDFLAANP